jgi:beta-phosphoglucomutase-like phosphatase (HAD superfamily)
MLEPRRGFIFDLDGTLVDTMPSHFVAWTEIARRHGLTFPEARFYALGGVPTAKIAAMLIAEAGLKRNRCTTTAWPRGAACSPSRP